MWKREMDCEHTECGIIIITTTKNVTWRHNYWMRLHTTHTYTCIPLPTNTAPFFLSYVAKCKKAVKQQSMPILYILHNTHTVALNKCIVWLWKNAAAIRCILFGMIRVVKIKKRNYFYDNNFCILFKLMKMRACFDLLHWN